MFNETIQRLASALEKQNIPYMIIGGQAVLLHGEPRLTRDIDITLGIDIQEYESVRQIVDFLGLKALVDSPKQFINETRVLPLLDPKTDIRIDMIFSFSDFERQAVKRSISVETNGYMVKYTTAEDLVIHKMFAGRPRDLEDVKGILLKNTNLNMTYIDDWLEQFDLILEKNLKSKLRVILNSIQKK